MGKAPAGSCGSRDGDSSRKVPGRRFHRALLESARTEIRKLQHEAGTDVEVCLEGGGVSTVVRSAALHHDADLVVIGRGKLHETLGRLRSNSYAIIRESPCPVISV